MIIAGMYSFNGGREIIEAQYHTELQEIQAVVAAINSTEHKVKISEEITMPGKILYSPASLNSAFKAEFGTKAWESHKIYCDYSTDFYTPKYQPPPQTSSSRPYREMDFVKNRVGVEVQSANMPLWFITSPRK